MPVYGQEYVEDLRMSGAYRHPFMDRSEEDDIDPRPFDDFALAANERNMIALSATIRAKQDWWIKARDATIRAKWMEEAVGAPVPYGGIPLECHEVQYVLDELLWYAEQRDEATGIEQSIFHRIWQSDRLIDDALHSALLKGVDALENVPDDQKDWHPRSNEQVLDLVHPSLYCIVYDRTVVDNKVQFIPDIQECSYSDCEDEDLEGHQELFLSQRFSWLPTDFAISPDGTSAKALAYINNLSPWNHSTLYPVIEQIVARFVPLWERVLGETRMGEEYNLPSRIQGDHESTQYEWIIKDGVSESDLDDEELENREHFDLRLPLIRSPFESYDPPEPVDLKLEGRNIQVIVKLANIYLTPEKSSYPGGSWHVEGMMNEAIISTGIYYYDEHNTTESALAFRMAVHAPMMRVDQNDDAGAKAVFGMTRDDPLNQLLGSVVTKQGRCLAFPNVYQHQVQPFELLDKSKPGHRKILALFLVDPELQRPSTTHIPPQQQDWMRALLYDIAKGARAAHPVDRKGVGKLPNEVLNIIVDQAEWLMSRKEAEEYRLELMDERGTMVAENSERMFAPPFNMCEH